MSHLSTKGWTAAQLSRESGISPPTLSRVLSGARGVTYDVLGRIALALEMSPFQLASEANIFEVLNEAPPWWAYHQLEEQRSEVQRRALMLTAQVSAREAEVRYYEHVVAERDLKIEELSERNEQLRRMLADADVNNVAVLRARFEAVCQELKQHRARETKNAARAVAMDEMVRTLAEENDALRKRAQGLGARLYMVEARARMLDEALQSLAGDPQKLIPLLDALLAVGATGWLSGRNTEARNAVVHAPHHHETPVPKAEARRGVARIRHHAEKPRQLEPDPGAVTADEAAAFARAEAAQRDRESAAREDEAARQRRASRAGRRP